jgi:hypothetical protein
MIDGFLLLILIFPWNLLIYVVLYIKGQFFSSEDYLQQLAGRLYGITQGTYQATLIAVLNVIFGALIVPNSSLIRFEQQFGPFSIPLFFFFLPLPGFFILNLKREEIERIYQYIYQTIVESEEIPEFIELTADLLTRTDKYTEEYSLKSEQVRNNVFQFLERNFNQITPFFDQKQPFRFNLESLAIFLTKKASHQE